MGRGRPGKAGHPGKGGQQRHVFDVASRAPSYVGYIARTCGGALRSEKVGSRRGSGRPPHGQHF